MTPSALSSRTPPLAAAPPPVAAPGLGAVDAPPAVLLGEHFAAALVALACGAVGLAFVAGDLAAGAFFLPRVAAVVHLFVLGWITLSIFGSLCQFLPVAIGKRLRWERLAHLSFASQLLGLAAFVGGLLGASRPLLHLGATLLTLAFTAFGLNLGATLASARGRSLTWWALAGATVFLLVTPAYGGALALNLHGDIALADRFATVAAHAHVAVVGFFFLVMVGVAHRLLPMFLLSHGASERFGWIAAASLTGGAALLALPVAGRPRFLAAGLLVAVGCLSFLVQAAAYFKHRKRRAVDAGVRLAAVGLVCLGLALLLAPFALSAGISQPRLLTLYFFVLLGGISFFVAGHYYKIVPFLVWYHRFGPLVGEQKVPKVSELWSERVAACSGLLLVGGWLGMGVSIYAGNATAARLSALPFIAGVCVLIAAMASILKRRPN